MAVHMDISNFSIINRAYARQSAAHIHRGQGGAGADQAMGNVARTDIVTLSADAPQPFRADYVEDALRVGKAIAAGREATAEESERIREDRVFAAVAALALLGDDGSGQPPVAWPGGFSAPTKAELETARRRLAQRLDNAEEAENPEKLHDERLRLLDRINRSTLSGWEERRAS